MPVGDYGLPEQTVIAIDGDWIRLAKNPFPTPVWINWKATLGSEPEFTSLFDETLIASGLVASDIATGAPRTFTVDDHLRLLERIGDEVTLRFEETGDKCGEDRPKIPFPAQFRTSVAALLDTDGRLIAKSAYPGGC
jgi:hypothetical protein